MKKVFLISVMFFTSHFLSAQEIYYADPVKIPILLSGSFGELRNNHFHSGIDIKTQGRVGIPVFAVADGYISRISVSPSGYGNAIYINHDNGTTSVYGHLDQFRPDIQSYIRNIQYERKSFQVDVPVLPGIFPVTKLEKFALCGNSGSSQGPHLHFELRNTKTEEPVNPLKLGFYFVKDNTPPQIFAVQIMPLSADSHVNFSSGNVIYEVEFIDGKYRIKNNPVIPVYGQIGFALEANDFMDGSANKCGISSMELTVNGVVYSFFEINRFSFAESRYINSFIDYGEFSKSGRRFQKTFVEPCNKLRNFDFTENNGIFDPGFEGIHPVKIELKDSKGNITVLEFSVEGKYREMPEVKEDFTSAFVCGQPNMLKTDEFSIELPEDALYKNLLFKYEQQVAANGYFSSIHQIHNKTVPLHKSAKITVKAKNLPESLAEKALLVNINPENGKFTSAGGKYENGWITADIRTFGNYAVRVDTVPPTILPLSIANKNTLSEPDKIRFEIKDDLAGIGTIEGLIDGKWALFEYDAKNNLITHYFDTERFEMNKQHNFKLTVTDNRGNSSVYEASFQK
jgi:hypothetical protein